MKLHGPISHHSHPQHELKWKQTETPFECNGCKDPGIGNKYSCRKCDFDLHEECALRQPATEHAFYKTRKSHSWLPALKHPFYNKCEFLLHDKLPSNMKCKACNKVVQGFSFRCRNKDCKYVLHPRCANLPASLNDGSVHLRLSRKELSQPCNECQKKGPGWSYRTKCEKYNLHVACAKEQLKEVWVARSMKKDENKLREIKTRIPKMVVAADNHHHDQGKILKWGRIVAVAVRIVASFLLGDPTGIAVGLSFISSLRKVKYLRIAERKISCGV